MNFSVRFDARRLRSGELIAGGAGVVLFVALFFLHWFDATARSGRPASRHGPAVSLDGWHALTNIRWVLLVTIVVSVALFVSTATRHAPAIPVFLSVLSTIVGAVASLLLLFRVIAHPDLTAGAASVGAQAGIYVALAAAAAVAAGGFLSLRTETSSFGDPRSIETVLTVSVASPSVSHAAPDSGSGRTESSSAERAAP